MGREKETKTRQEGAADKERQEREVPSGKDGGSVRARGFRRRKRMEKRAGECIAAGEKGEAERMVRGVGIYEKSNGPEITPELPPG